MKLAEFIPLLVLAGLFWMLVLRPSRRRQREAASLQQTLVVGSRVMLTSGIFGTVTELATETIRLEIAPGSVIEVHRRAVANVVDPATSAAAADDPPLDTPLDPDGER